jgi:hypothetical protein
MIDPGSELVAIATLAAVGFGFHTGIPLLASRFQGTPRQSFQPDLLRGTPPPTREVVSNYFQAALTSAFWSLSLISLSIPYLVAALLDVISWNTEWPSLVAIHGAPNSIVLALWSLELGIGLSLLSWLAFVLSVAYVGLSHEWKCWRLRSKRAQLTRALKDIGAFIRRQPQVKDPDPAVGKALDDLKQAVRDQSPKASDTPDTRPKGPDPPASRP